MQLVIFPLYCLSILELAAMEEEDWKLAQDWYDKKTEFMVKSLGPEHDEVMHALIPYEIGGALDLYYYPHGIPGTGIATKELSTLPNAGSKNDFYKSYELVMFTRCPLDLDAAHDDLTSFGRAHKSIDAILNRIAPYSEEATLNPYQTCEFPDDMDTVGGKCLVFDGYACHSDEVASEFGLLLLIEVFRPEMEFAQQHGGKQLIDRLKAFGYYPYSDLNRESVV